VVVTPVFFQPQPIDMVAARHLAPGSFDLISLDASSNTYIATERYLDGM
jgi:hypothetical protein